VIGKSRPEELAFVCKKLPQEKLIGFILNDFRATHTKFSSHKPGNISSYAYQSYKAQY